MERVKGDNLESAFKRTENEPKQNNALEKLINSQEAAKATMSTQVWYLLLIGCLGIIGTYQAHILLNQLNSKPNTTENKTSSKNLGTNLQTHLAQHGASQAKVIPSTPSVREAAAQARSYKETIKALETPETSTNQEVEAQGFVVRPIEEFRIHKPYQKPNIPDPQRIASTSQNLSEGVWQLPKQTKQEARKLSNKAKNAVEVLTQIALPTQNNNSKSAGRTTHAQHHYSMDETNKRILLTNAKTLSLGTPRTIAKKILGKPTKETMVALPQDKELAKMLVYSIKIWKQGVSTPSKDEKLILLFDSADSLLSMEFNDGNQDSYRASQSVEYAQYAQYAPKLANVR
jgi:hypothetical protein